MEHLIKPQVISLNKKLLPVLEFVNGKHACIYIVSLLVSDTVEPPI